MRVTWRVGEGLLLGAIAVALFSCGRVERRPADPIRIPVVVLGIDGADWRVIERLWSEGKLPHLRALAERGSRAPLKTFYGPSPVIWTSIATGVVPEVHGITAFEVPTPQGSAPVSSTLRKVPALWNMATLAHKKVAVLGWWGTWPAEPVRGVVISDRATLDLPDRVSPAEFAAEFEAGRVAAEGGPTPFPGNENAADRDRLVTHFARRFATQDYELLLVYFRGLDIVSHKFWKYFEPEAFPGVDSVAVAKLGQLVPNAYQAVDAAIGEILAALPEEARIFVLSDHGFHAEVPELVRVHLDEGAVFERLGLLRHTPAGEIDFTATRVYGHATSPHQLVRKIRFALAGRETGGRVRPEETAAVQAELEHRLSTITYESGAPVFRLRAATDQDRREGADFMLELLTERPSFRLLVAGQPWDGLVQAIVEDSGGHTDHPPGIFLAAGPDIRRGADLAGITIHDIAPTLLFTLGLPIADDFRGEARLELFSAELVRAQPLRRLATWGKRPEGGGAATSVADRGLLDELRALGYIN